jgi:hypothetical protein
MPGLSAIWLSGTRTCRSRAHPAYVFCFGFDFALIEGFANMPPGLSFQSAHKTPFPSPPLAFSYLFHLAPLGMPTTAPNWQNQIAPWWMGLPGKHATRLSAAHLRATAEVCTSGCLSGVGSHRFVSVALSFASSLSRHRQDTVRGSSVGLCHGQFPVGLDSCPFFLYNVPTYSTKCVRKASWRTCSWPCWVHCES